MVRVFNTLEDAEILDYQWLCKMSFYGGEHQFFVVITVPSQGLADCEAARFSKVVGCAILNRPVLYRNYSDNNNTFLEDFQAALF